VKSLRGNEGWHHDSTYMPIQAKGAVFSAEIVPRDVAPTGWADMRAAYEALDDDTRARVDSLTAHHSLFYSQGRAGYLPSKKTETGGYNQYGYHDKEPSLRPLVKIHPDTGRPNLCIGRHAYGIVGIEPEESERLLDDLNEWACQPPRVYFHDWVVGDVVVWDNRRLMHRATPFDMTQPRRMWHTRIAGEPESELALNHR
jgi:alpha-ketoglutarate-dependent taurine dioxygenase